MIDLSAYNIVIENPKGTYKDFEIYDDPEWKNYPLAGVTYPVDYGYISGYTGEDGAPLDVFVGTGEVCGYIKIWRVDVPEETKVILNTTESEYLSIVSVFISVIIGNKKLSEIELTQLLATHRDN